MSSAGRSALGFAEPLQTFLKNFGAVGRDFGVSLYLIGGTVRDLLLGLTAEDLDLMVEGSAIDFAEACRDSWDTLFPDLPVPAKINKFPRYGTVKLEFSQDFLPGKRILDFASARSETYASPGARPEVMVGNLQSDLLRRDFSINAMAISLFPNTFGVLYDYHSGEKDLRDKKIRILHKNSFVDDPIRLLRAVRFMVRFAFTMEAETELLFQEAVRENYLRFVTRERCTAELRKARSEKDAERIFVEAEARGILTQLER